MNKKIVDGPNFNPVVIQSAQTLTNQLWAGHECAHMCSVYTFQCIADALTTIQLRIVQTSETVPWLPRNRE